MTRYELPRTKQDTLRFEGEEIAKVYGEWWNGIIWTQYHNLAVYRTADAQYVLAIQYRTGYATVNHIEQPHDDAFIVAGDRGTLMRKLETYNPLVYLLDRPYGALDVNFLRSRYYEMGERLLNLVRRIEEGAVPPLREAVVVDYWRIDNDVREALAERGVQEGLGHAEVLRRGILQEMEAQGETGVTVEMYGIDDIEYADDEP